MAISHRKLFLPLSDLDFPPPPSPPPPMLYNVAIPLPIPISTPNQNREISSTAILVVCVLAVAFLLFIYMTFVKKYYLGSNDSSMMNPPAFDFALSLSTSNLDTGGLRQSIVESIAVFKYKRGDGLIEGTECSVCLNEFEEDETLRLLPKCSHAFHIPCIDTWLSSHKNCPLCRAPIIISHAAEPILNHSAENLENRNGLESREGGSSNEMRVGDENSGGFPRGEEGGGEEGGEEEDDDDDDDEVQPVRRPISKGEIEGCSSCRLARENKLNLDMVAKEVGRNSSRFRVMKSSSFGHSFRKGPVAVNRSSSFSGKVTRGSQESSLAAAVRNGLGPR